MYIRNAVHKDTLKNVNEGGRQTNVDQSRASHIWTLLEASDLVSDCLIQTCCKRLRNQQEPSVVLLLEEFKATLQL